MVLPSRRLSPRRRADPRHGDRRPATATPGATHVDTTTPNGRAEPGGNIGQPPRHFGTVSTCSQLPDFGLACRGRTTTSGSSRPPNPGGAGWRRGTRASRRSCLRNRSLRLPHRPPHHQPRHARRPHQCGRGQAPGLSRRAANRARSSTSGDRFAPGSQRPLSGGCVGESLGLAEADVDGEVGEDIGHLGAISKLHGRAGG